MPALYPEILVLRHGQTEWNALQKMQGRLNSPLTEQGRAQAAQQNTILSALDLTGFEFFCSPQGRAFTTAAIALDGIADEIRTHDGLREVDMNVWAGQTIDQVFGAMGEGKGDLGPLDIYTRIPGGEGLSGLFARCEAFLNSLSGPAVIVTHGMTSRCLRLIACGRDVQDVLELPGGQGIVYRVKDGVHSTV